MNERVAAVDSDNPLTLAVNDNWTPLHGGLLQYTLTYGNRNTSQRTGSTLSLPPAL